MSEHRVGEFVRDHKKAEAVAATILGAAAVPSAAYILWRRQHREGKTYAPSEQRARYEKQLTILDEERIRPVPVGGLLAPVAARVHYATFNTAEQVITREQLLQQLGNEVDVHHLQKALSYLQGNAYDLIGRRPSAMNENAQGYYSKPVLNWAVEQGENDTLLQAYSEFINQLVNGRG